MKAFMSALLTYSAAMSVIIIFYMAVTPLLAKRYCAKGLYYTWLVIVIGLIIPFRPDINITGSKIYTSSRVISISPIQNIQEWTQNTVTPIVDTSFPHTSSNINPWHFIGIIWFAGVIIFITRNFLKYYNFIKMSDRWSEKTIDQKKSILFENVKKYLGISKHIDLYICSSIKSPMMIGFIKPKILLPKESFPENQLEFILKHELIHYKRKDVWYKCLVLFAASIHWFNPVVYLMTKAIGNQCEISCDAEVVQNADFNLRQQYCNAIINMVKNQSKLKVNLSNNFYGGKNGMKKRILSITDTKKKTVGLAVFFITLILTITVGMTSWDGKAKNTEPDVDIRLADSFNLRENFGTSVSNVDSRPGLEFYIEGADIAKIEISCETEYLYIVDWTETQHEKYRNVEYYQHYDEETQTCTFYPERLFDKSITLTFDEDFEDYEDIWYRWDAWNLYRWASEDNYSRILGSHIEPSENMTDEEMTALAAGEDSSGTAGIGYIQLDGYPEELTEDKITIKVTDIQGNSTTKIINVKLSNNERNETVVTAKVE